MCVIVIWYLGSDWAGSVLGLEYNIGRIPMASCDFSTHPYSYDDVDGDLQLSHFALAPEDLKFKVRKFYIVVIIASSAENIIINIYLCFFSMSTRLLHSKCNLYIRSKLLQFSLNLLSLSVLCCVTWPRQHTADITCQNRQRRVIRGR